jgi:hypothetical protein
VSLARDTARRAASGTTGRFPASSAIGHFGPIRVTTAVGGEAVKGRILVLGVVALTAAVGTLVAIAGGQATTGARIGAFPMPGTVSASPETQISLRGAPAAELGSITVSGSRTGDHAGTLREHSDGQGASFVLERPLRGGERVAVKTDLNIPGASGGAYSFRTVTRPQSGLQSGTRPDPSILKALTGQKGTPPKGAVVRYRSRPDLRPPEIQVRKRAAGTADGLIFIAPKKVFGARTRAGLQSGPLVVDNSGEPVWFAPAKRGKINDFRLQQYQGKPVLTWWEGRAVLGTGEGVVQIADSSYNPVTTVRGGNGYQLDFHETTITPQGTLLGLIYNPVARDLSFVGGPRRARVVDAVVQEIDIATGLVMFEWHSLGTIGLEEGLGPIPRGPNPLWDYVHPNSAVLANDGNVLVSARETWAAYKLDRRTGRLLRRIGGKKSDLKLGPASTFAWQHDIQELPDGTLRIFDNQAAPKVRDESRALILSVDEAARRATRKRAFVHKPDPLLAGTQGNVQGLSGGRQFIGWGSQGYFSEFAPDGRMLFDARIARGQDTYRAYRFAFTGTPRGAPAIAAEDGGRTVYASFNGATALSSWELLAGSSRDALQPVASAPRRGFETRIRVRNRAAYVAVRAKDAAGQVLGTSKAVRPER